ncbi:polysaccharide biosynthesis/export family protein [bacterium]|nr:polysaccharide biosynthesis/export family protein [bacterium]
MGRLAAGRVPVYVATGLLLALLATAGICRAADDAVAVGSAPQNSGSTARVTVNEIDRLVGSYHRLSANDMLRVNFFDGRQRQSWEVSVDGAGNVTLPYIGTVQVAGLLPAAAAARLQEQFQQYYRQPLVDLNVLEFGQLQVFLVGSDQPGRLVTMRSGETLYGLLQSYVYTPVSDEASRYPGIEPVDPGSYRRVHLIRGAFDPASGSLPGPPPLQQLQPLAESSSEPAEAGDEGDGIAEGGRSGILLSSAPASVIKKAADFQSLAAYTGWTAFIEKCRQDSACSVEVYDPLLAAREANPAALAVPLLPGDIVYLPTPLRSVTVFGVAQPGRYELLEEENLADVLRLAGTVDLNSDLCNAIIERDDGCCNQAQLYVDIASGMNHLEELAAFEVQDRDIIRIQPRERRIFVLGEVQQAGAFDYAYDSLVTDYLAQAGGMTGDANTGWLALIRGNRDRRYPLEPAEVIQVNFKEIQKGHEMPNDYRLLPGDTIYVPPKGASFSFSQVISSLTSGFAIFKLFDDGNGSSNNGNGNGDTGN